MIQGKIRVQKFCSCGARLDCTAKDEDDARRKVMEFFSHHTGRDSDDVLHLRLNRSEYWLVMKRKEVAARIAAQQQQQALVASAPNRREYKLRRV